MSSKGKANARRKPGQVPAKKLSPKPKAGAPPSIDPPVPPDSVLGRFLEIAEHCRSSFKHGATFKGVFRTVLAVLANSASRSTLTAALAEQTRSHSLGQNKSYKHFERSPWDQDDIFKEIFRLCLVMAKALGLPFVAVAIDDTMIRKTGKRIKEAAFMPDPLGPKWRYNLVWGIRFLHAAFMIPTSSEVRPWPVSVGFDLAPSVKKKRKKQVLTPEEEAQFKADKIRHALTTRANVMILRLRTWMNELGFGAMRLLMVGDGSFTNGTIIRNLPPGVDYIGRTRRTTKLVLPDDSPKQNKLYGRRLPTPEEVLKDNEAFPMQVAHIPFAGHVRAMEYKEIIGVLWPLGTKQVLLRLIVFRGLPRTSPSGLSDRAEPVYLLTTDLESSIEVLGGATASRWQIEVLHKDLKDGAGIGEPQCWNPHSVRRVHSTLVAGYSMLNLAIHQVHGSTRTEAYPPLEKWRSKQIRPSHRDKVTLLRNDIEHFRFWPKPTSAPALPQGWCLDPRRTFTRA